MSYKILLVEDEPSLRMILSDSLRSAGFEVLLARNGEEGLFIASEERPDLILLDMIMPKMNGVKMAEKLAAQEHGVYTPIIFLSNLGDGEVDTPTWHSHWEHLVKADWKIEDIIKKVRSRLAETAV